MSKTHKVSTSAYIYIFTVFPEAGDSLEARTAVQGKRVELSPWGQGKGVCPLPSTAEILLRELQAHVMFSGLWCSSDSILLCRDPVSLSSVELPASSLPSGWLSHPMPHTGNWGQHHLPAPWQALTCCPSSKALGPFISWVLPEGFDLYSNLTRRFWPLLKKVTEGYWEKIGQGPPTDEGGQGDRDHPTGTQRPC